MAAQAHVDAIPLLPDLGVARVEVEIYTAPDAAENRRVAAKLIEEEVDLARDLFDVLTRQANVGRAALPASSSAARSPRSKRSMTWRK
jgi:hypothetical protein